MLRKILKVFLVIVFIGFISAYVRGIHYNSNKEKANGRRSWISGKSRWFLWQKGV